MISRKYKFIYIHIPKTGGNSIQSVLAPYCDDRVVFRRSSGNVVEEDGFQGLDVFNDTIGFKDPQHKHASIADYFEKLGDDIHSFFIFTSIRNPWDRVISRTAFATPGGIKAEGVVPLEALLLPRPMTDYVSLNGTVTLHDMIRFEKMQEDFDRICDRIGIEKMTLPHKNRSVRGDYTDLYTDESITFVHEKFKTDIEYFGYSFSGSAPAGQEPR